MYLENLQPWQADFQPLLHRIRTTLIWVRMPGLLLEYGTEESVKIIAAKIGKLLRVDERISIYNRGKFLRMCRGQHAGTFNRRSMDK